MGFLLLCRNQVPCRHLANRASISRRQLTEAAENELLLVAGIAADVARLAVEIKVNIFREIEDP